MSEGKYLSLEEARGDADLMRRFAREHRAKGDEAVFDALLERMAEGAERPNDSE